MTTIMTRKMMREAAEEKLAEFRNEEIARAGRLSAARGVLNALLVALCFWAFVTVAYLAFVS